MATVNAISVSPKSHLTFGSSQNSATISPKMVLGTDEVALSAVKGTKPSALRRFFTKAMMGAAVLSSGFMTSCGPNKGPIDPIDPPVTSILSPTQKTFGTNFNTKYVAQPATKSAEIMPKLPAEMVVSEGGMESTLTYDYSNPDTVVIKGSGVREIDRKPQGVSIRKTFIKNGVSTSEVYAPVDKQDFSATKWAKVKTLVKDSIDTVDSKVIEITKNLSNGQRFMDKFFPLGDYVNIQNLQTGDIGKIKILKLTFKP